MNDRGTMSAGTLVSACRLRRNSNFQKRTRLLDHAGEDQSHSVRSTHDVAVQVFGNDHAVAFAGSQAISAERISRSCCTTSYVNRTPRRRLAFILRSLLLGIEPNEKRIKEHLDIL